VGEDDEVPALPQRIVGSHLPPEAYTARYVGRASVPDHRFRTDEATVRLLLDRLRRWRHEA
jgi:hypothetical protein